jgi:hypothetical protein
MSNRKPNFYSFLIPVVLVSFAPLLGHAAPPAAPAACSLPANAPASAQQEFKTADPGRKAFMCKHFSEAAIQAETPASTATLPAIDTSITGPTAGQPIVPAQSSASSASSSQALDQGDLGVPSGMDIIKKKLADSQTAQNQAPAPQVQGSGPAPTPKEDPSQMGRPAQNGPHYLSSDEAQSMFPDLKVYTLPAGSTPNGLGVGKPTSARLGAYFPNACADNFSVQTTSNDGTLQAGAGTVGFAIYDKGGLAACLKDPKNDCANDISGTMCTSMSSLAHISLPSDGSAAHVAYLDFTGRHDSMSGQSSWAAKDIPGSMKVLSDADIASEQQAKQDEDQSLLKNAISACIKEGDLPVAQESLNQIMSPSLRATLQSQLKTAQDKKDVASSNQQLAKLDQAIDEASQADDAKASDKVEEQIKDFATDHPSQADAAAEKMKILAQNLVGGEDGPSLNNAPSAAAVKDAKRMLNEVITDDDDTFGASDTEQAKLKNFLNTEIVKREVQASVARLYNLSIQAQTLAQKDPSKALQAQQKAATEMKNATKLQENAIKTFTSDLKKMGCIKETNTYAGKVEEDSPKALANDDLSNSCNEIKQDRTDVQNVNQSFQTQYQAALKTLQQQQQQAQQQAIAQQRAAMGGQQQQQGLLPTNTTFGPSLGNNGSIGMPGMIGGVPSMSIPNYTGGYMNTSPTTMGFTGYPMNTSYNPYSYTGIGNMGMGPSQL